MPEHQECHNPNTNKIHPKLGLSSDTRHGAEINKHDASKDAKSLLVHDYTSFCVRPQTHNHCVRSLYCLKS